MKRPASTISQHLITSRRRSLIASNQLSKEIPQSTRRVEDSHQTIARQNQRFIDGEWEVWQVSLGDK